MNFEPPVQIAAFLACVTFLVMLAVNVMKLVDRMKGRPPASEVQREALEKFVSKAEFSAHQQFNQHEHENIFKKIGGVERGNNERLERMLKENMESREKLHGRINDLVEAVSRLEGRFDEARTRQKMI